MKITRSPFSRRSAVTRSMAVIAAGGLVLGLAACGDDDDDDSGSAGTTTAASTDSASSGSDGAGSASESAGAGADGDASDAADATDGASAGEGDAVTDIAQLPGDIAAAYEQAGGESGALGAFTEFTTSGENTLATFANGWITSAPDTGAQPLIGEIGKTWFSGGGLDNEIGLPTAPESGDAVAGWDQTFQNGTIGWHPDESGTWGATE